MNKKEKSARAKPIADGAEKFSGRLGKVFRVRQEPLRTADQGVLRVVSVETVDGEPRHTQVQTTEEEGETPTLLRFLGNERRTEKIKH